MSLLKYLMYAGLSCSLIAVVGLDIYFVRECCKQSRGGYEPLTSDAHEEDTHIRCNARMFNYGQREFWHYLFCDHVPLRTRQEETVAYFA